MTAFPTLFSPIRIGPRTVKNRICCSAHADALAEDGTYEVTSESTIRATATAFHITINLTVTRNGKPFFHKKWMVSEPRRLL